MNYQTAKLYGRAEEHVIMELHDDVLVVFVEHPPDVISFPKYSDWRQLAEQILKLQPYEIRNFLESTKIHQIRKISTDIQGNLLDKSDLYLGYSEKSAQDICDSFNLKMSPTTPLVHRVDGYIVESIEWLIK